MRKKVVSPAHRRAAARQVVAEGLCSRQSVRNTPTNWQPDFLHLGNVQKEKIDGWEFLMPWLWRLQAAKFCSQASMPNWQAQPSNKVFG